MVLIYLKEFTKIRRLLQLKKKLSKIKFELNFYKKEMREFKEIALKFYLKKKKFKNILIL